MKILVIAKRLPWPICHGDRLHCYELVRRLARQHEVLLIAQTSDDGQVDQGAAGFSLRDRAKGDVAQPPNPPFDFHCWTARNGRLYDDAFDPTTDGFVPGRVDRYFGIDLAFAHDVVRFVDEWRPHVVVGMNYHILPILARIKNVPTICDLLDDEALHALLELLHGRADTKWNSLKCTLATLLFQRRYIRQVDAVTVLSEADRRFCRLHTGHPHIHCIPHGVDCDYYAPLQLPEDENRIIFWGSLGFGPNIGAIEFFAEKVWPVIRKHRPNMRWTIAGRGHSPRLARFARLPGVDWLGFVDDLRPLIAEAAVVVVPMLSGAGIKNKVMQAWAMGKTVLCTPRALGSLPGRHGENVWLAKSAKELSKGLLMLAGDRELRGRIGRSARQTAMKHCSWERAALELQRLCREVVLRQPIRYDVELGQARNAPAPVVKTVAKIPDGA